VILQGDKKNCFIDYGSDVFYIRELRPAREQASGTEKDKRAQQKSRDCTITFKVTFNVRVKIALKVS
jgi:hypothetical protein